MIMMLLLVLILLLGETSAQRMSEENYIKGSIDVARCRASCTDKFLPSTIATDSSCDNSPDCNMCWQTCSYLFENYFLWVDMCNDYIICLPGCRQACNYWDDAKSAGLPQKSNLHVDVSAAKDLVLFQWSRPENTKSHVVFVLRAYSSHRSEWIVLSQTLDNSCTVQKHYINDESRYQLVAVTQYEIISLMNVEVDLTPVTTPLITTSPPEEVADSPSDILVIASYAPVTPSSRSKTMAATFTTLATVCIICCAVVMALMFRRYQRRQRKLKRTVSTRSAHRNLTRLISTCQDYTVRSASVITSHVLKQGEFGLSLSTGFYKSIPVYIKSLHGDDVPSHVKQELLLEISKFGHLRRHTHFLSIVGVAKEQEVTVMAVERLLEFTTLHRYLRTCYADGEVVNGTLHCFVPCGQTCIKQKTTLTPQQLISIIQLLANTMEALYDLDYVHKELTADHIIIDPVTKLFKLVDPELSREVIQPYMTHSTDNSKPICFMSPEVLKGQEFTSRSDIWSFGMLIWQIIKFGETPLAEISEPDLYDWLCNSYRPQKPVNCSEKMYDLMLSCWSIFPEQRPNFSEIGDTLNSMLDKADTHCSLLCHKTQQNDCVIEMVTPDQHIKTKKTLLRKTISHKLAFDSPLAPPVPPTKAMARSFLPSHSRLGAISEYNQDTDRSTPTTIDDDDVFDDDHEIHSPDNLGLLSGRRFSRRNSSISIRRNSVRSVRSKLRSMFSTSM